MYDVRLNDRAMHVFPPYRYEKQRNYLELANAANAPDTDDKWLRLIIDQILAGGGTDVYGRAGIMTQLTAREFAQAINEGSYMATGSYAVVSHFCEKTLANGA